MKLISPMELLTSPFIQFIVPLIMVGILDLVLKYLSDIYWDSPIMRDDYKEHRDALIFKKKLWIILYWVIVALSVYLVVAYLFSTTLIGAKVPDYVLPEVIILALSMVGQLMFLVEIK